MKLFFIQHSSPPGEGRSYVPVVKSSHTFSMGLLISYLRLTCAFCDSKDKFTYR